MGKEGMPMTVLMAAPTIAGIDAIASEALLKQDSNFSIHQNPTKNTANQTQATAVICRGQVGNVPYTPIRGGSNEEKRFVLY